MAHFGKTGLRGDDYERFDFGYNCEGGAGMTNFEERNSELYIDGKKVIRAWESFSGWYWFAVKKVQVQDSVINDKLYPNDVIWFGLVQGLIEEWGDFSQKELELLSPYHVWEIPKKDLLYAGRRNRGD